MTLEVRASFVQRVASLHATAHTRGVGFTRKPYGIRSVPSSYARWQRWDQHASCITVVYTAHLASMGFCLSSASNRYIFRSVHSTSMTIGGVSICGVAMNLFIAGHELGAAGTSCLSLINWSNWTVVEARTRRGRCVTASAELEIDLGRAGDLKHSTHAVAI